MKSSWVSVGFSVWIACSSALAQDDAAARRHFEAGATYYDIGDYARALEQFEAAYSLSNRPELFYNLSLCHQQLGSLDEAARLLEAYLGAIADLPNRPTLELRLVHLRERAALAADRRPSPTEPPEPLRSLEPSASPPPVVETPPEEASTERPAPIASAESLVDETEPIPSPGPSRLGLGLSFGAAGAGAVLLATFGGLAVRERAAVREGCGADASCSGSDVARLDRRAAMADVGLGITVAGAALGTVLVVVAHAHSRGDDSEAPRVAIAPLVDPRTASMSLVLGGIY